MSGADLRPVTAAGEDETECWACGGEPVYAHTGPAAGVGKRCYGRWRARGFTGPGPYYAKPRVAGRLEDYAHVITTRSAAEAARQIGVTRRTITRWRRALRQAS